MEEDVEYANPEYTQVSPLMPLRIGPILLERRKG